MELLQSKTIEFNGEEVVIKKIPLIKYGALAMSINELPKFITDLIGNGDTTMTQNELLERLPLIIVQLSESMPKFLSVASGIEQEKVEECGLDDAIVLLEAILECNNIGLILSKLKNLGTVLQFQIK